MNSELRVLMLSSEYTVHRVGGLGAHVVALAPRIGNQLQLDLVVPRYNGLGVRAEPLGDYGCTYRVDATKPAPGSDFDLQVWHMNDQLNAFASDRIRQGSRYDIIHAHDWLTGYVANDLHRRYGIPLVVTIHATESGRMGGFVRSSALSERIHLAEHHMAMEAQKIIACSDFMRDEIERELNAPCNKIIVIPNGVESDNVRWSRQHRHELAEVRRQWQPDEGPLICFVGRLVWEKGPDLVVGAMAEVQKEYPAARVIIAGHGPYREHLINQIADMRLQDRIRLAGFISDEERDQLYAVADLAVFPSRYEPFGIVALEAMVTGIPVVVAATGGLKEVVLDGVTGLSVSPGRVDTLTQAILQTLADPHKADERALLAQNMVKSRYHWDNIASRTVGEYERLVNMC